MAQRSNLLLLRMACLLLLMTNPARISCRTEIKIYEKYKDLVQDKSVGMEVEAARIVKGGEMDSFDGAVEDEEKEKMEDIKDKLIAMELEEQEAIMSKKFLASPEIKVQEEENNVAVPATDPLRNSIIMRKIDLPAKCEPRLG